MYLAVASDDDRLTALRRTRRCRSEARNRLRRRNRLLPDNRFSGRLHGLALRHRVSLTRQLLRPGCARLGLAGGSHLHRPVALPKRQSPAEQLLDLPELLHLIDAAEGNGSAIASGATRSADAVDVCLGLHGHVVVDDVAQSGNVDAPRSDVRRDQHLAFAALEGIQRRLTGVLALIPVDGHRFDALALQLADNAVCTVLCAAENERVLNIGAAENLREQVLFIHLIHIIQVLVDFLDGG